MTAPPSWRSSNLPIASALTMETTALVTVGSTSFDALVASATTPAVRAALAARGFTRLVIQYGRGAVPPTVESASSPPLEIVTYRFKPSLAGDMAVAGLVISHAGAGSILEALRGGVPTIVVVNTALMNNHQAELAGAMADRGHLALASPVSLAEVVGAWDWDARVPLPPPAGVFGQVLGEELAHAYDPWG